MSGRSSAVVVGLFLLLLAVAPPAALARPDAGGKQGAPRQASTDPAPDSDGDGTPDAADLCPKTAGYWRPDGCNDGGSFGVAARKISLLGKKDSWGVGCHWLRGEGMCHWDVDVRLTAASARRLKVKDPVLLTVDADGTLFGTYGSAPPESAYKFNRATLRAISKATAVTYRATAHFTSNGADMGRRSCSGTVRQQFESAGCHFVWGTGYSQTACENTSCDAPKDFGIHHRD